MERYLAVHGRVMERHPEISPEDVAYARTSRAASATRRSKIADEIVAVGFDANGKILEMVAIEWESGEREGHLENVVVGLLV